MVDAVDAHGAGGAADQERVRLAGERAGERRALEHRDVLGGRADEVAVRQRADHQQVAVEAEVAREALDDLVGAARVDERVRAAHAGDAVVAEAGVDVVVGRRADDLVVAVAADEVDPAPLDRGDDARGVEDVVAAERLDAQAVVGRRVADRQRVVAGPADRGGAAGGDDRDVVVAGRELRGDEVGAGAGVDAERLQAALLERADQQEGVGGALAREPQALDADAREGADDRVAEQLADDQLAVAHRDADRVRAGAADDLHRVERIERRVVEVVGHVGAAVERLARDEVDQRLADQVVARAAAHGVLAAAALEDVVAVAAVEHVVAAAAAQVVRRPCRPRACRARWSR